MPKSDIIEIPATAVIIERIRYEHLIRCESQLAEAEDMIRLLKARLQDFDSSEKT